MRCYEANNNYMIKCFIINIVVMKYILKQVTKYYDEIF